MNVEPLEGNNILDPLEAMGYELWQMTVSMRRSPCEYAALMMKRLGDKLNDLRPLWLITIGGNWPDRFSLLNRYLRTDMEPDYFEDERWES